ncbi:putative C2H2-type domain-containing protein [Seiridium unicorne]|uniref:C2H2-type domain-containing protein n=1 Tax=Seiridium unicorne TaxID=138068 RepID=A0ABR2UMA8_9PEZI
MAGSESNQLAEMQPHDEASTTWAWAWIRKGEKDEIPITEKARVVCFHIGPSEGPHQAPQLAPAIADCRQNAKRLEETARQQVSLALLVGPSYHVVISGLLPSFIECRRISASFDRQEAKLVVREAPTRLYSVSGPATAQDADCNFLRILSQAFRLYCRNFPSDTSFGGLHSGLWITQTIVDTFCATLNDQEDIPSGGQSGYECGDSFTYSSPHAATTPVHGIKRKGDDELPDRGRKRSERDLPASRASGRLPRRQFACPFFLRNVHEHPCQGFNRIGDVRQHLFRKHMQQKHCPVCGIIFTDNRSNNRLESHIREDRCTRVDFHHPGVTTDQWREICQRAQDQNIVGGERWFVIWRIIFPHDLEPPSPYIDGSILAMRVRHISTQFFRQRLASQVVDEIFGDVTPNLRETALGNFHVFMDRFLEFTHRYDDILQVETGRGDTTRAVLPSPQNASQTPAATPAAGIWTNGQSLPVEIIPSPGVAILDTDQEIPGIAFNLAPGHLSSRLLPHFHAANPGLCLRPTPDVPDEPLYWLPTVDEEDGNRPG